MDIPRSRRTVGHYYGLGHPEESSRRGEGRWGKKGGRKKKSDDDDENAGGEYQSD